MPGGVSGDVILSSRVTMAVLLLTSWTNLGTRGSVPEQAQSCWEGRGGGWGDPGCSVFMFLELPTRRGSATSNFPNWIEGVEIPGEPGRL